MRKQLVVGCALTVAIVVLLSEAVQAERPSQHVLESMGLSGLQIMSDDAALAVRGSGWRGRSSSVRAWGRSSAEFNLPFDIAESESENRYNARGRYYASGRNGSSADIEIELEHEVEGIFGFDTGESLTIRAKLSARGYSSARAF